MWSKQTRPEIALYQWSVNELVDMRNALEDESRRLIGNEKEKNEKEVARQPDALPDVGKGQRTSGRTRSSGPSH